MKYCRKFITGILAIILFHSISTTTAVVTYVPSRSQGSNTPRHLVGLIQQLYARSFDSLYGTLNGTLFYNRSFNSSAFSESLFGVKECETITISGSQVTNRGSDDWLADYFYLPTDFKSKISFKPVVDNSGIEFEFFVSLDEWTPGLYVALYAPLVHSRWNINMCETIELLGTNSSAPGYFTPDTLARNSLLNNFTQYANGTLIGPVTQTVAGTDFTITFQNLLNAKISNHQLTETRLADMRALFGYYFVRNDRFNLALQALITAPVGNRPEGEFIFEPTIGNGHHWEFGGSIFGNGILWQSADEQKQIIFTGDISMTHLFGARQKRVFDLDGKPFSRYMLIERLGTPITNNLKGNNSAPSAQFVNEFLPVANLTKLWVDSSITLQAEATALITFVCDHFSWDVGYNFWGITCEKLSLHGINPFENNSKWALKGDAQVFGFDRGATGAGPLVGAVALSATETSATITTGTNLVNGRTVAQALLNPAIDAPQNGTGDATGGSANHPLSAQPNANNTSIKTSIDPLFITSRAINVCERRVHGSSSKLFTHFNYTWLERSQWKPYIGIGGEAEFSHSTSACESDDDTCINAALSQWGIWLKGGMTF